MSKKIAVLALQGAFIEHERLLATLGVTTVELRQSQDVLQSYDGLILPGGESTVQGKLLRDMHMLEPLREQINQGLPTFGTCAGMILLSESTTNDRRSHLQTMPITVKRNAYGRQSSSFITTAFVTHVGMVPMHFIRAPYIESVGSDIKVLATVDDMIVAAQYKRQLAVSFHPEVTDHTAMHEYFLSL